MDFSQCEAKIAFAQKKKKEKYVENLKATVIDNLKRDGILTPEKEKSIHELTYESIRKRFKKSMKNNIKEKFEGLLREVIKHNQKKRGLNIFINDDQVTQAASKLTTLVLDGALELTKNINLKTKN